MTLSVFLLIRLAPLFLVRLHRVDQPELQLEQYQVHHIHHVCRHTDDAQIVEDEVEDVRQVERHEVGKDHGEKGAEHDESGARLS